MELHMPDKIKLYLSNTTVIEFSEATQRIYVNLEALKNNDGDETDVQNIEQALAKARQIYKAEQALLNILKAENLIILTGAGSSKMNNEPSGKLMSDLYSTVFAGKPDNIEDIYGTEAWLKEKVNCEENNLETLLSRIDLFLQCYNNDLPEFTALSQWKDYILKIIKKECSFAEKAEFNSYIHRIFLNKIITKKQSHDRTKIFTLNYDTAFEKAAQEQGIILIDGFNFSSDNSFNGNFFDYDIVKRKGSRINEDNNFVNNVAHLYKLHGSVTWKEDGGKIIRHPFSVNDPIMIMPNRSKYEESYKKPFFEMMSRFQQELRRDIPSTLLIIGYGFGDNHINSMINEALNKSNFNIVIITPSIPDDNTAKPFVKELLNRVKQNTVTFIGDTFNGFVETLPIPTIYKTREFL